MAKQVVGLDIGEAMLRAAEVMHADKPRPVVLRYHEVALPEGAVRGGEVVEANTVATALNRLWAEGKFRSRRVVLGIGNQKVIARDLTVPKQPLERIREALPFQVQELIPVPVADALLDFYPIAEHSSDTGDTVTGLLVAAVKESVMANVAAVRQAGLTPVDVDLIPFALQRALGAPGHGTVALVDIGAATTNVVLASAGVPQFVRIIPSGGEDITRALMGRLEISREQAEQLKMSLGMATGSVPVEYHPAVEVIYDVARELLNSLRNTINYFTNTRQHVTVDKLVLAGGAAQLPGLPAALAEVTRNTVEYGDPFANVTVAKEAKGLVGSRQGYRAGVALGLAIGSAA